MTRTDILSVCADLAFEMDYDRFGTYLQDILFSNMP